MHHIGVDIIEISRIRQAAARWGTRFLHRLFTGAELELYRDKPYSLAARFAGKEAVIKALGGEPRVHLHGRAQERARALGLNRLAISLSHSRDYAVAMVIGETE